MLKFVVINKGGKNTSKSQKNKPDADKAGSSNSSESAVSGCSPDSDLGSTTNEQDSQSIGSQHSTGSEISNQGLFQKTVRVGSEDSTYTADSCHDSSSGIVSDDHNFTSGNSESSPTLSSHEDRFILPSKASRQCSTPTPPAGRHTYNNQIRTAACVHRQYNGHKAKHYQRRSPSPITDHQYMAIDSSLVIPKQRHRPELTSEQYAEHLQIAFGYHETDLDDFCGGPDLRNSRTVQQYPDTSSYYAGADDRYLPMDEHVPWYQVPNGQPQMPPHLARLRNAECYGHSAKKKCKISYFDVLPDDVILKIFRRLHSDQLCRCSRVCHRWHNLVWDPSLWTSIRINSAEVDADRALKVLSRRLSYDTPTVCVMVESINLNGCEKLTDKGLCTIARRCPELRHLEMQGCPNVSNIALFEVVSKCVNLEHLNVAGCACITCICLTPEATVQAASYGKQIYLRYLDMTDCSNLEDAGLQILASYCSQLVHLYLRRCTKVTDLGVQYIANYCMNLREFSISDCRKVTDFGMRELSKLGSNLRYLSVAKCDRISDVGVKYIARCCHKMRYLNVRGCEGVSDDSVEMLAKNCHRLKSLDIGKCDVSDEGLQVLAENCPQLRKLSLKSCDAITDQGLIAIATHCRSLQQLNVQDCHLTPEAYRTVKKFCKRCIIEHTNPGFY